MLQLCKDHKDLKKTFDTRYEVFCIEQNIEPREEVDQYDYINDQEVKHFYLEKDNKAVCVIRVILLEDKIKIGRVCTLKEYRNKGLMHSCIKEIINYFENDPRFFYLESQVHALGFYEKLGFEKYGEEFMDAGIPHYKMKRDANV